MPLPDGFSLHWKRLRGEKIDPMDFDDSAVARMVERFPDLRDECGTDVLKRISGPELLERVYRYCTVQVDGGLPCAYLTAGLPVKRGDTVRVPYGSKNEPRKGIVRSVDDYTRDTAPWPPERTKRVLEILQAPAKKDPAAAKPQQGGCR